MKEFDFNVRAKHISLDTIEQIIGLFDGHIDPVRPRGVVAEEVQLLLTVLAGQSFSLADKTVLARRIQKCLLRYDLRISCPNCGEPALLRAAAACRTKEGNFQFLHSIAGKLTGHAARVTLPMGLLVISATPSRQGQSKISKK